MAKHTANTVENDDEVFLLIYPLRTGSFESGVFRYVFLAGRGAESHEGEQVSDAQKAFMLKQVLDKYLNNIPEQDRRFTKRNTGSVMGLKALHSATESIARIEAAHIIRKGHMPATGKTPFQTFAELAA
ncbi:DDE-type integrase/transposase/recombinase [Fuscovulum blasticum]|uniref:DDE-type integrase/transposase/recombinase n=1 Tax=Fuscovulum blasticum TaxID=1075 RepID=UPI000D3E906F|nr:hypothetical protein B6K69_17375 [Fuscovulum blasticum]